MSWCGLIQDPLVDMNGITVWQCLSRLALAFFTYLSNSKVSRVLLIDWTVMTP